MTEMGKLALGCGASKAAEMPADRIVLSDEFRKICEGNGCGMYGRSWMCPPVVGEIGETIARVRTFGHALLYQTIGDIEDSYDIEGMNKVSGRHGEVSRGIEKALKASGDRKRLHLTTGCHLCEKCAKLTDEPCRHPDLALPSMSGFGVDVYHTCEKTPLRYINGQNTVTYFGLVLWNEP